MFRLYSLYLQLIVYIANLLIFKNICILGPSSGLLTNYSFFFLFPYFLIRYNMRTFLSEYETHAVLFSFCILSNNKYNKKTVQAFLTYNLRSITNSSHVVWITINFRWTLPIPSCTLLEPVSPIIHL